MDETLMEEPRSGASGAATSGAARTFDDQRACTRCDGQQHLVGEFDGLGKYRCDSCEMIVGFDVHSDPAEFLLHRGLPSRYSKDTFGESLMGREERISSVA